MAANQGHIDDEPLHDDFSWEDLPSVREGHIRVVSKEEAWELFDAEARRYFDMSGEEFICAWESGKFDDDPDAPNVMWVAMMIPLVK